LSGGTSISGKSVHSDIDEKETVEILDDKDVKWADLVILSAMSVYKQLVKGVIARYKAAGASRSRKQLPCAQYSLDRFQHLERISRVPVDPYRRFLTILRKQVKLTKLLSPASLPSRWRSGGE
jgi:hypothetical protein